MKHTAYTFTFQGFNFCADFAVTGNGIEIQELLLESGIDDEMIEIKDQLRLDLVTEFLTDKFFDEIDNIREEWEWEQSYTSRENSWEESMGK